MKPLVLFVVNSPLYVRNYLTSDALADLARACQVKMLVRSDVVVSDVIARECATYENDPIVQAAKLKTYDIMMFKFASRSTSFSYRIDRQFPAFAHEWRQAKSIRNHLGAVKRSLVNKAKRIQFSWKASSLYASTLRNDLESLPVNADLEQKIVDISPDIVIFPSGAHDSDSIDIAVICRKNGIRSLHLIDNWDNLSSKSIMWEKPDFLGVWGEQSREHAVEIQGFVPDQAISIGTPRFNDYFVDRNRDIPSHFDFPYVLFVGTSLPFNEAAVLQILNREIVGNPELYGDLHILYRPHPWRQGKDSILGLELDRVHLDPQVAEAYSRARIDTGFQPSLDYYSSLLRNARFVVGGMTSMAMESQIFYKRFLGMVHDEPGILTSPAKVFKLYAHFRGLETVDTISFCDSLDRLPENFRKLYLDETPVDKSSCDEQRRYFLYDDERTYSRRLADLVTGLLENRAA